MTACSFLNEDGSTAFVVLAVVLDSFGDALLEDTKRVLSDFLFSEVISDKVLDKFGDILIALGEIFGELIDDHDSKLFSLLYGLRLLDG